MPPAEQHRGLLRAEMMRESCVELTYNYYFNEPSFSFACASIFYFTCFIKLCCYLSSGACIDTMHTFISEMPKMYDFHWSNAKYINPSRETIPLIRPLQCDSEGGCITGVLLFYTSNFPFPRLILLEYVVRYCQCVEFLIDF